MSVGYRPGSWDDPQVIDEDAIVKEIMARGQTKKAVEAIPEDVMPYDWELLQMEKVMNVINAKMGTSQDLEAFRKEIVERFAEINWHVEVEVHSTDQEGTYTFDPILVGRLSPVNKSGETDFDRRRWDVINDTLEIAPELKGETIPFSEAMVHNPDLAQD